MLLRLGVAAHAMMLHSGTLSYIDLENCRFAAVFDSTRNLTPTWEGLQPM